MKPKDVIVNLHKCKKCAYEWYPNIKPTGEVTEPKICPFCHQDWRKPKVRTLKRS